MLPLECLAVKDRAPTFLTPPACRQQSRVRTTRPFLPLLTAPSAMSSIRHSRLRRLRRRIRRQSRAACSDHRRVPALGGARSAWFRQVPSRLASASSHHLETNASAGQAEWISYLLEHRKRPFRSDSRLLVATRGSPI